MTYERVDLGKGLVVPSVQMNLTGSAAAPARRELAASLYEILDHEGALLIRDSSIEDTAQFAAFLESIEFRHHTYVGGTSTRTKQGRGVYTSTELPPAETLPSHQEMSYLDTVPDYAVFYCQHPADDGQKTNLFLDMRAFTESLPDDFAARYRGKRARLHRTLPNKGKGSTPEIKYWQDVLETSDRDEARTIAAENDWELTWTPDGKLTIRQEPARFFRPHPVHGELWCTQAMLQQPRCWQRVAERAAGGDDVDEVKALDRPRQTSRSTSQMFMEDGGTIPEADVDVWFDLMMAAETSFALQRGDVILLDNMLVAHGRSSFVGKRKMYAALGDRLAAWR